MRKPATSGTASTKVRYLKRHRKASISTQVYFPPQHAMITSLDLTAGCGIRYISKQSEHEEFDETRIQHSKIILCHNCSWILYINYQSSTKWREWGYVQCGLIVPAISGIRKTGNRWRVGNQFYEMMFEAFLEWSLWQSILQNIGKTWYINQVLHQFCIHTEKFQCQHQKQTLHINKAIQIPKWGQYWIHVMSPVLAVM